MEENKLKSIKMSLMKIEGDINDDKPEYTIKSSGTFNITPNFYSNLNKKRKKELTINLLNTMYNDLLNKTKNEVDSVGIWINYNQKVYENAIKISVLSDIEKYGADDVDSIYEFFKMSIID